MAHSSLDLSQYSILAIDDEPENLQILKFHFRDRFSLFLANGPKEAHKLLSQQNFAVILSDQRMPQQTGLELLQEVHQKHPETIGVILSAYSDLDVVLDALNSGTVYRYLLKPWKKEELFSVLKSAIERYAFARENQKLLLRLQELHVYHDQEEKQQRLIREPIGVEAGLKEVGLKARQVAATDATVLLQGESGSGKEVFARFIHENSKRKDAPFIRVNLGAFSTSLLESELFGHKKGAFTDALDDRIGRFELADTGTLFLDEIGELPLAIQVKLLRVLQERIIERVGDTRSISINIRLICATHRNLNSLLEEGHFREDLYYRIHVFPINIPPLRERKEDIPALVMFLLDALQYRVRKQVDIDPSALEMLLNYDWPGNVRELENVLERALILAKEQIDASLILSCLGGLETLGPSSDLAEELLQIERQTLLTAIENAGGSKTEAAQRLGISRSTLYYRLRRVGLQTSNDSNNT